MTASETRTVPFLGRAPGLVPSLQDWEASPPRSRFHHLISPPGSGFWSGGYASIADTFERTERGCGRGRYRREHGS